MGDCKSCKFAEWEKTATNRLSPTGRGRCKWEKVVRMPISSSPRAGNDSGTAVMCGGTLWRNEEPFKSGPCPTFQPKAHNE